MSSGLSTQLVVKQKLHQTALQAGDGHSFSCFKLEVEIMEREPEHSPRLPKGSQP